MRGRFEDPWSRLTLAQRFMLASLGVLLSSMLVVGWWVGSQIEHGVLHRTAATTALYVESFISPQLQELGYQDSPEPEHLAALGRLLQDTSLSQQIVAFKVWGPGGRIVYATGPSRAGMTFPEKPELLRAWQGEVVWAESDLEDEENALEREQYSRLLEYYIPIRLEGTGRVIAVAEFYQGVEGLVRETDAARVRSWLVVAATTLATYLLLAGMVRRGSDTIEHQQAELSGKVAMLTELLAENQELNDRVRRAATRTAELNERFLRRISAELHDGPAQDLSLSLLRLDHVIGGYTNSPSSNGHDYQEDLETIQISLTRAMQEVRAISTGLRLPELDNLTPADTVARVVRTHERRTASKVALSLEGVPEQVPVPIKITLYRLVQEALSNAYRHGGGVGQRVRLQSDGRYLTVTISDDGPGFDWARVPRGGQHLGLIGMRERVESLGGIFRIETGPGRGTKVVASLPLDYVEDELITSPRGERT